MALVDQPMVSPIRRAWRSAPQPLRARVNRVVTKVAHNVGLIRGALERGGPAMGPVCTMGLFQSVLGLGAGARLFHRGLEQMGVGASTWDVSDLLANDQTITFDNIDNHNAKSVICHINPVEHIHALALSRSPRPRAGFRVGYWAWETSRMPSEWKKGAAVVDEVWCPTVFTSHAAIDLLGNSRPVRVLPYPVPEADDALADKARFDINPDKVTFFSACDLRSSLERKNPLGAIEAFKRSGCGPRGEAELLIKIHGAFPGSGLNDILEAASKAVGVWVLNCTLTIEEMKVLRASIDVVLSPHRSEGFGLVLAQAMRSAKPVIATGWSGNMDFMNETSAALIQAKEVPVGNTGGNYKTGTWAEPDLDHAAHLIAKLAADPAARHDLGMAGLAHINAFAEPTIWQNSISQYLNLNPIAT